MNLLEYIRERNNMTQDAWENTFEKEEREIIVLRHEGGGASKRNGFWATAAYFLAYVDCTDGSLHKDEGRIVYPITDEAKEQEESFWHFQEETIYRLKVRKKMPECTPEGITESSKNEFLVVQTLEVNPSCPILEELLAEYQKPIFIHDDTLGALTLNKKISHFEGYICWKKKKIAVFLDVNKENKSTWTKARNAMKAMLSDQEKWDGSMRTFAAKELTYLACEWCASADEPTPEITEQSFAKRITLSTISMTAGGSFSAYFDDDDMFFGHCVTVCGSLKKGVLSAAMEG